MTPGGKPRQGAIVPEPFIVSDPAEPGRYDHEWALELDDWTDGVGSSPDELMQQLLEGTAPPAAARVGRARAP